MDHRADCLRDLHIDRQGPAFVDIYIQNRIGADVPGGRRCHVLISPVPAETTAAANRRVMVTGLVIALPTTTA